MRTVVKCMGECLIDFVPLPVPARSGSASNTAGGISANQREGLPKDAGSTDFRMYPGGSLLNVAVGLARLGQHAAFAGKVADDFLGRYLLRTLCAEGVDTRFLTPVKGQTALAFVAMERDL